MIEELQNIEAITTALYATISFAEGQAPDFDRLRLLFTAGARLIHVNAQATVVLPVEAFVTRFQNRLAAGELVAFQEWQVAARIEHYGEIAHVFSTYEAAITSSQGTQMVVRGINSIQLMWEQNRWWVVSLIWTDEQPGKNIPAGYLP